jgi:hypothetical protein
MCKSVKFGNLTLKINPQSGTLSVKVVKAKKIRPDARQRKEKKDDNFPSKCPRNKETVEIGRNLLGNLLNVECSVQQDLFFC